MLGTQLLLPLQRILLLTSLILLRALLCLLFVGLLALGL